MTFRAQESRSQQGFTLIELLVVLVIIALLIGILIPAIGGARKSTKEVRNGAHLRALWQALEFYAAGNGSRFPTPTDESGQDDLSVEARFEILLQQYLLDPDVLISPADTTRVPWTTGSLSSANYSYALLEISSVDRFEQAWVSDAGAKGVLAGDRNTSSPSVPESIWTVVGSGRWIGDVLWTDGSVQRPPKPVVPRVRYGALPEVQNDALFVSDFPYDAFLIYEGTR